MDHSFRLGSFWLILAICKGANAKWNYTSHDYGTCHMTMEHVKWLKLLCKDLQRTIYIAHMIGHTKIVIWISSSSKLKVKLYNYIWNTYMNMEHVTWTSHMAWTIVLISSEDSGFFTGEHLLFVSHRWENAKKQLSFAHFFTRIVIIYKLKQI